MDRGLRVFADTGAEADSISGRCATELMREQAAGKLKGIQPRAFLHMARYRSRQSVWAFLSGATAQVHVEAELVVCSALSGAMFPPVLVRVVVNQEEDVLLSRGTIKDWGLTLEATTVHFTPLGIRAARGRPATPRQSGLHNGRAPTGRLRGGQRHPSRLGSGHWR